jgi:hypothetical protein
MSKQNNEKQSYCLEAKRFKRNSEKKTKRNEAKKIVFGFAKKAKQDAFRFISLRSEN